MCVPWGGHSDQLFISVSSAHLHAACVQDAMDEWDKYYERLYGVDADDGNTVEPTTVDGSANGKATAATKTKGHRPERRGRLSWWDESKGYRCLYRITDPLVDTANSLQL